MNADQNDPDIGSSEHRVIGTSDIEFQFAPRPYFL
jgi:hypothetical protein